MLNDFIEPITVQNSRRFYSDSFRDLTENLSLEGFIDSTGFPIEKLLRIERNFFGNLLKQIFGAANADFLGPAPPTQ